MVQTYYMPQTTEEAVCLLEKHSGKARKAGV